MLPLPEEQSNHGNKRVNPDPDGYLTTDIAERGAQSHRNEQHVDQRTVQHTRRTVRTMYPDGDN